MRASRLLRIQLLLEQRGRLSARVLAEMLEVSVRTLHRDIDELTAAGVPVYADRGRAGGFRLMPNWRTTLTGLTPQEAQTVLLAGLAGPLTELGLGDSVRGAELKLRAAIPDAWRTEVDAVRARIHVDPGEWYWDRPAPPALTVIAEALWRDRRLSVDYDSWQRRSSKRVDPLGLVIKAGVWYLVARAGSRTMALRAGGIASARLVDEPARRPVGFELATWWRASVRRFEAEVYTAQARVAATRAGLASLARLSSAVERAVAQIDPSVSRTDPHRATALDARSSDERIELTIPIESIAHATGQLLRLAPEVKVIGPPALLAATRARLEAIVAMYAAPRRARGA